METQLLVLTACVTPVDLLQGGGGGGGGGEDGCWMEERIEEGGGEGEEEEQREERVVLGELLLDAREEGRRLAEDSCADALTGWRTRLVTVAVVVGGVSGEGVEV